MSLLSKIGCSRKLFISGTAALCFCSVVLPSLFAQDNPAGPMNAPTEHHVTRIGTEVEKPAPPTLAPEEIIKRFSEKEDESLAARTRFGFRRSIRIQEFGANGQPGGEFLRVTEVKPVGAGRASVKTLEKPESTLQHVVLEPEDLDSLDRVPAYPLTTKQLPKYQITYLGKEQLDEIDCYIFQAHPKVVDRNQALFEGLVWVDSKYLDVVKTYGKWVTDQGASRALAQLPFVLFETYRENVAGRFWFPDYSRSDEVLEKKDLTVPMRITIKWSDFSEAPLNSNPPAAAGPVSPKP